MSTNDHALDDEIDGLSHDPIAIARRPSAALYAGLATLMLFCAWEAFVRIGNISPLLLPAPTQIAASMRENFSLLMQMSVVTISEFLLGFLLALVVGVPLGALTVYSKPVRLMIYPLVVAFQTIPKAAVAPIFVIWLGAGMSSKLLIAFAISFFPIVVDTIVGLRAAAPETIHLVRSMGAGPIGVFWFVRLPAALPTIFGGLKVACTLAVVGAIVGEFVSADSGLGYLVLVANGELNTRLVFACVVTLTILGTIFYGCVEIAERLCIGWHVAMRGGDGASDGI